MGLWICIIGLFLMGLAVIGLCYLFLEACNVI